MDRTSLPKSPQASPKHSPSIPQAFPKPPQASPSLPEGSRRLRKVQAGSGKFGKGQEGSGRFRKAQEGSGMLRKAFLRSCSSSNRSRYQLLRRTYHVGEVDEMPIFAVLFVGQAKCFDLCVYISVSGPAHKCPACLSLSTT